MPPWDYALGAFVGGGLAAAIALWWCRQHRWPWPEFEDLEARVGTMEHRMKMLQGRLNSIAPPREGTGNGGDVPRGAQPLTRADLLRAHREKER